MEWYEGYSVSNIAKTPFLLNGQIRDDKSGVAIVQATVDNRKGSLNVQRQTNDWIGEIVYNIHKQTINDTVVIHYT